MRNLNPITKILCILAINITITFGVNVIMELVLLACVSGLFMAMVSGKNAFIMT